jgi:xanthine dehydrogenase YagS FAD-binding subunit
MNTFEHVTVTDGNEAVKLLSERGGAAGETKIIAGGTDLLTLMNASLIAPQRLVNLKAARALRYLRFAEDGALHIGALATLADLERDAGVARRLPILVESVRDAATPQLRAMATVAGNLLQRPRCWYFRGAPHCWLKGGAECFARDGENKYHAIFGASSCVAVHPSDLAPALLALDAELLINGPSGVRTLPLAAFFHEPTNDARIEHTLAPDEVITEIRVPGQPEGANGAYLKMMDRQAWAFALASAAAQLSVEDGVIQQARIVLGGVATVPWRATQAEDALTGQQLTPELARTAAEAALAGAAPLAHNGYKVPLARELVRRAILRAGSVPHP